MTEDKYALTAWGATTAARERDLELPSGQTCRIKELLMEDVLELDIMDALDVFTSQLVTEPGKAGEPKPATEGFLDFLKNREKRDKLMKTINNVIPAVVVAPRVLPLPPKGRVKKEGAIYVDMIGLNDKLAIFAEVFAGMGDMGKFREEQEEGVGAVAES